eukprot:6676265-Prymnesium_polylepis.1
MLREGGALLAATNASAELSKLSTLSLPGDAPPTEAPPPPLYSASIELPTAVSLAFAPDQLAFTAAFIQYLGNSGRYELWRRFRPENNVRPTDNPRLWWHQLTAAVMDEVKRVRPRFDWRMLKSRRQERMKYITLHARGLRAQRHGQKPDREDRSSLLALEKVRQRAEGARVAAWCRWSRACTAAAAAAGGASCVRAARALRGKGEVYPGAAVVARARGHWAAPRHHWAPLRGPTPHSFAPLRPCPPRRPLRPLRARAAAAPDRDDPLLSPARRGP